MDKQTMEENMLIAWPFACESGKDSLKWQYSFFWLFVLKTSDLNKQNDVSLQAQKYMIFGSFVW